MHPLTPERVKANLDNWSQWMRRGGWVRGYGKQTPGIMTGNLQSWEDLQEQCDSVAARCTDAAIADLPGLEQAAVNHYHLAAVWRFHRDSVELVYDRAVIALGESLARKGMV